MHGKVVVGQPLGGAERAVLVKEQVHPRRIRLGLPETNAVGL
jgi:hypothetical protein